MSRKSSTDFTVDAFEPGSSAFLQTLFSGLERSETHDFFGQAFSLAEKSCPKAERMCPSYPTASCFKFIKTHA